MTALLYVGSAALAFVLAAAITPLVARAAESLGLMDIPGGRRNHPRPIARPGGLAIALAFGLTVLLFWVVDRYAGRPFLIPEEVRSPRFTPHEPKARSEHRHLFHDLETEAEQVAKLKALIERQ